jgi:hypothetical protein
MVQAGTDRMALPWRPTMVPMKILRFIHLTFSQAFYGWALREIDPMHPDLPKLVMKRQELADEARRMFA